MTFGMTLRIVFNDSENDIVNDIVIDIMNNITIDTMNDIVNVIWDEILLNLVICFYY